jgi:hypothetical protein
MSTNQKVTGSSPAERATHLVVSKIGEDEPEEEEVLRGVWEDGDDWEFVLETLENGVELRAERPSL